MIINTGSSVDHECVIGDGVHIAPGAHLAAGVTVERGSWVDIGSVVREGGHIGSDVMIGAGSVVLHDIPDGAVAYGIQSSVVRQQVPADDHPTYSSAQNPLLLLSVTFILRAVALIACLVFT